MYKTVKRLDSSEGNVWKYIFEFENAIAEAVLYKYDSFNERTVICCSVQSGCPIGCTFCGTGKRFIRNLSNEEILSQITYILKDMNIEGVNSSSKKFQIMFMSMGEPMLNFKEVERAIRSLHILYPNADLLMSTIGVDNDDVFRNIIELSKDIHKVGLQFSIHKSCDADRNELIPYKNKMSLYKLRDAGLLWWKETGRKPYLNYCVDGTNNKHSDFLKLYMNFSPLAFCFTFSVVCSADETMKKAGFRNLESIQKFQEYFLDRGYDCRIFNPAGQDDIGGGCGQLFYVQQWLKDYKKTDKI
jgi:23S rRNA (adenine2503-C2)-methyltransferase